MSKQLATVWTAPPHTIAKIVLLQNYMHRWFTILGLSFTGTDLWYIDGFAGPGEYANYSTGSPIAVYNAAVIALRNARAWRANHIHCLFIEEDTKRFQHLEAAIAQLPADKRIHLHLRNCDFNEGIQWLKKQSFSPLANRSPVFALVDPFGARALSFETISGLLERDTCEVLVNFDSDGIARVYQAGEAAKHEKILDNLFGSRDWQQELMGARNPSEVARRALRLYQARLRAIRGVRYTFSFEMKSHAGLADYHLIFASHHPRGLEKMKEVMRIIDQTGSYSFCDAHVGQETLIDFNDPAVPASKMCEHFVGQTVSYALVHDYALNESPFQNPKMMLATLEKGGKIAVHGASRKRRNTYPDELHESLSIQFL